MFFRQYQLGCLSLYSYLVGDESSGRAVVVDPQRDVSAYLADAEAAGLSIERVFETHFHADFLSGHLELAAATGAAISYGEGAEAEFPIEVFADGQRLVLGEVVLEVRATPGHTPESISIVVYEHDGEEPWAVLTGDTLFVGDVGRPDLLASVGWSADELARRLYRSLRDKLLTLPDGTRVYPAHGAGSACGKHMSAATESTIGDERANNYALAPMSENDFVAALTEGQAAAPLYFAFASGANRRGHDLLDEQSPPPPLDSKTLDRLLADGALVVDTRSPEVFGSGHLRGSVNVGLDGRFAEYAGAVVRPGELIVLVTDPGRETEAKIRLARIGFDRVAGSVSDVGRILAERPELATRASRLTAADVAAWRDTAPDLHVVDVRNRSECDAGIIVGAREMPLPTFADHIGELDPDSPCIVYCAGGYRSSTAASLLRSKGFTAVADVLGGYDAWRSAGLPTTAPRRAAAGDPRKLGGERMMWAPNTSSAVPIVDVAAAADPPGGVALVDVREPDEWAAGHAPQAVHIPLGELSLDRLPVADTLDVICRSGGRSGNAVSALRQAGIDARNVSGGMLAWAASGHPVVNSDGLPGAVL